MGFPAPSTASLTEDTDASNGLLEASGDIDYYVGDDTGDWTVVTDDTSQGAGSSFSMDADGNWTFSVDNEDPAIQGLNSGESLEFEYTVTSDNGTGTVTITVFGVDEPPCFARGTLIATPAGPRPIETLKAGDDILTADRGPVPIRWIGSKEIHGTSGGPLDKRAPIEIQPGAFGPGVPERTLRVSPMHRMLWRSAPAQLLFGASEVLCPAKSLVNGETIVQSKLATVEYFHILLDTHGILLAEGCESESLYPGREGLYRFGEAEQEEIFDLFPELRSMPESYGASARPILKPYEVQMLLPDAGTSVPQISLAARSMSASGASCAA